MSAGRLRSGLVASACLNAAAANGKPAVVLRRGDADSGMVFVKSMARDGQAVLYAQTVGRDGASGWRLAFGPAPERDVDARIEREANMDRDLWALEIMDDAMAHPLAPPLVEDGL